MRSFPGRIVPSSRCELRLDHDEGGLKPTLRIVHMVTMHGIPNVAVACAIAETQLYSSHYFETALDLSFCIRRGDDAKQPGFYLIMAMGSEQASDRGEGINR